MDDQIESADSDDDLVFYDGATLSDLVAHVVDDENGWRFPGLDRIGTVIALVAAHSRELRAGGRYAAAINYLRFQEHCLERGVVLPPPGQGGQEHLALDKAGAQSVRVLNDEAGPQSATHRISTRHGAVVHVWSREPC